MKVFITGGTGFIGTHLVRMLRYKGYDLLLLTRTPKKLPFNNSKKITVVAGDLSNINDWKYDLIKFQPDATIHMAWEGIPDYGPETSVKNLKYGLDLIKLLAEIECRRFICTGSCWEYGQQHGKLHEDLPIKPFNAFASAKNALHWLGKEIAKENNMIFIWTRLFYVYGIGQKETSLIPYVINCVRRGKKPEIKTPFAKNDFIYVEDVADALTNILTKCKQSTIYNIGSGSSTSAKEIVNMVYDSLGIKNEFEAGSIYSDEASCEEYWADLSKIKTEIGWKPKLTILEGLKRTIQEYEK